MGLESAKQFGLYLASELAAGAVAAVAYKLVNGTE
jgi:hypothetical protein